MYKYYSKKTKLFLVLCLIFFSIQNLIAEEYRNFFINKNNKKFVLIDSYPSIEALDIYITRSKLFPLHFDAELSVTELSEIIKYLYQFKRQKEYQILTIGATERVCESEYIGKFYTAQPHLFFLIGNDKTLAPFNEYNGKYSNVEYAYKEIFSKAKGKDLIGIEADRTWDLFGNRLDIDCYTQTQFDSKEPAINYYDFEAGRYRTFMLSSTKNIFSTDIKRNLACSKRTGIRDVFDFKIDYDDTFIAKVLISIIIYKRNNCIKELGVEDYNHIFKVLFNEEANILDDIEKDIPKHLVYKPRHGERTIFAMDPKK